MVGRGKRWERGVAAGACLVMLAGASGPLGLILGAIAAGLLWQAWAVARTRNEGTR